MKKIFIGIGIVLWISAGIFLLPKEGKQEQPQNPDMCISTGINQILTKNETPKIITFDEETEEEMKENLVNILKYRTCTRKNNFDKTVTILCSEIITPTTTITKEGEKYKLETSYQEYSPYDDNVIDTVIQKYEISDITSDGNFLLKVDYTVSTLSTQQEYDKRRKTNFENLFSVFHYQREKEQDYEDIKEILQDTKFQGGNFVIPWGLNDEQYEHLQGSLDEYLLNHQGTCERENLSFLINLNENNRSTLLSSLSHFCTGEKEERNLNTLKEILTFPQDKWQILVEIFDPDRDYDGYYKRGKSKYTVDKPVLNLYYQLSNDERIKILPYFHSELPTFLKDGDFLDRLLKTIHCEEWEIEDLKYLLSTNIFTLQDNRITKIPDYTKAHWYNNTISTDHFKKEVYYKNHWYVERWKAWSFFAYNDDYQIFLQFNVDKSWEAWLPELILYSYIYDHKYIKFSRKFLLSYASYAYENYDNVSRNTPSKIEYPTYTNADWETEYQQTIYTNYTFEVPQYLIIMGERYNLEEPEEARYLFEDDKSNPNCDGYWWVGYQPNAWCRDGQKWYIWINQRNLFLENFNDSAHAENFINETIQKRGYIDGEYAVSFKKYPNIIFKYSNKNMRSPLGVTFIEEDKMIREDTKTLTDIEKTKQILCKYWFKGTSLNCKERQGVEYDSLYEKTIMSVDGNQRWDYKRSWCENYETCTFTCPYLTKKSEICDQCSIDSQSYKSCYNPTKVLFRVEKTSLDHWYFFYPTTGVRIEISRKDY